MKHIYPIYMLSILFIFVMYSTLSPDFLPQIAKADISQEPVEHENILGKLPHLHMFHIPGS
jgi:hypothetical protein